MALSGSFDLTMILWDLQIGKQIRTFSGHKERVLSVAFSPDGREALSSSADSTLILWDVQTGRQINQFKGHTDAVPSVVFGRDGHSAISGSHDKTLRMWDLEETADVYQIGEEATQTQVSAAISPDGRLMLLRSGPTSVALWNAQTGELVQHFSLETRLLFLTLLVQHSLQLELS